MNGSLDPKNLKLAEGVELKPISSGGTLIRRNPLRISALNEVAFNILQSIVNGYCSEHYVKSKKVTSFLSRLCDLGLLEWVPVGDDPLPLISIIIPVYNRTKSLISCLKSLDQLNYPKNKLEIIVVDDGSQKPLTVQEMPPVTKLIRLPRNRGQSTARNIGVRNCNGEIVAFVDSDCTVHPSWLTDLVPYFEKKRYALVGGYVGGIDKDNTALNLYEKKCSPLNMGEKRCEGFGNDSVFYVPTCNMLVLKEAFDEVGGFDEDLRFGEDVDLCWRLLKKGKRSLYLPCGVVFHHHRTSLLHMIIQRFNYGTSEPALYKTHKHVRKHFLLALNHLLCLPFILYASFTWSLYPLVLIPTIVEVVCLRRITQLKKVSIQYISTGELRKASYKSIFVLTYHALNHVLRYYLWLLIVLSILCQRFAKLLIVVILIPPLLKYFVVKPKLDFARFWFFSVLDQLAYQTGVIWGTFRSSTFRQYKVSFKMKSSSAGGC